MGPSLLPGGGETKQDSERYNEVKYKYLNGYVLVIWGKLAGEVYAIQVQSTTLGLKGRGQPS